MKQSLIFSAIAYLLGLATYHLFIATEPTQPAEQYTAAVNPSSISVDSPVISAVKSIATQDSPVVAVASPKVSNLPDCVVPDPREPEKQPVAINMDDAYDQFIANAQEPDSSLHDIYTRFTNQHKEPKWGDKKEQQIRDFIQTHESSYAVELNTVICKSSSCEISGTITNSAQWDKIYSEMFRQPWWNFSKFGDDTIENKTNGEVYFYKLARLVFIG
ncbi:MAG: hypothetical protein MJK04_19670 [Psychrosphaera sp.]|nr:hypothetical protein [Psychrosphaera sp.]